MVNNTPVNLPAIFTVIFPAKLKIYPRRFSEAGLYKLRVEIYDYRPYSSFAHFDVKVTNSAPFFLNNETMKNLKLHFNNTFEFLLPPYQDPDGNNVKFILSSQPNKINNFAKFSPSINPDRIIFNPTQWSYVGTYKVITILTNSNNSNNYTWDLEIYNTPPYFSKGKKPVNQKVRFNSSTQYVLPLFSDDEFNRIEVINNMP